MLFFSSCTEQHSDLQKMINYILGGVWNRVFVVGNRTFLKGLKKSCSRVHPKLVQVEKSIQRPHWLELRLSVTYKGDKNKVSV